MQSAKPNSKPAELLEETGKMLDGISRFGPACESRALEALRQSLTHEMDQFVAETQKAIAAWREPVRLLPLQNPEAWVAIHPQQAPRGQHQRRVMKLERTDARAHEEEAREEWKKERKARIRFDSLLKLVEGLKTAILSGHEDQNLSLEASELVYMRVGDALSGNNV